MSMQPLIQDFETPADSDQLVTFTIASTVPDDTLDGATVYFRVYEQEFGVPVTGIDPVLEKSSNSGGDVLLPESPPMTVSVTITKTDVADLLANYYYEVTVVAVDGFQYPPTCGIMTVTATENRIT